MNAILSLQRMGVQGLDPCIWSGFSCVSDNSCVSSFSKPTTTLD